jgi:YjgF/chorismate_mutase-like, putative endoribonuclease
LAPERLPSSRVNFVNAVPAGNLLLMAGTNAGPQSTMKGKVGKDLTVEQGYDAAGFVGILMLSKIRSAAGSLDRVKRVVKILGMVNAGEGFTEPGLVINGFSDLFVAVLGAARLQACEVVGRRGEPRVQYTCRGGDYRRGRMTKRLRLPDPLLERTRLMSGGRLSFSDAIVRQPLGMTAH